MMHKVLGFRGLNRNLRLLVIGLILAGMSFIGPRLLESKNLPKITVYLSCDSSAQTLSSLCVSALQAIENTLKDDLTLIEQLNGVDSHSRIVRSSAPNPLPDNAIFIALSITKIPLGLGTVLTIKSTQFEPVEIEQTLTVMDAKVSTHLSTVARFLGRSLRGSLVKKKRTKFKFSGFSKP